MQTAHGNTVTNCEIGRLFYVKNEQEKDPGVTMNVNMKVSEQCRIAASIVVKW